MFCYGGSDNARSGYPYIDDAVGFSYAVEGACHKGIVFRCIAEYDKFGRAKALLVNRSLSSFFYNLSH